MKPIRNNGTRALDVNLPLYIEVLYDGIDLNMRSFTCERKVVRVFSYSDSYSQVSRDLLVFKPFCRSLVTKEEYLASTNG